ncbi:MAG: hypothetical protein AAGJ08_01690 [Cyanobacteria bacterium P01_H01_bin.35]
MYLFGFAVALPNLLTKALLQTTAGVGKKEIAAIRKYLEFNALAHEFNIILGFYTSSDRSSTKKRS